MSMSAAAAASASASSASLEDALRSELFLEAGGVPDKQTTTATTPTDGDDVDVTGDDEGPPHFEGWLRKKGYRKSKAWRDRFFVLRNGCLRYYLKSSHVETGPIKGEVPLLNAEVRVVYGKDSRKKNKFPFTVAPANTERVYELSAAEPELRDRWKALLEATVAWNSRDIEQKAQFRRRSTQNSVPLTLNVHVSPDFLAEAGVPASFSAWRQPLAMRGLASGGRKRSLQVAEDVVTQMLDPKLRLKETACMVVHNQTNFLAVGNDKFVQLVRVPSTQTDMLPTRRFMQTGGCVDMSWHDSTLIVSSFGGKMYVYDIDPQSTSAADGSSESSLLRATLTHPKPAESGVRPGQWHPSSRVQRVVQNADGSSVLSLYRNSYHVWDLETQEEDLLLLPSYWDHLGGDSPSPLFAADWSPHRLKEFVVAGARCCIYVLDERAPRKAHVAWTVEDAHDDTIRAVAFSPFVEPWLASAGDDGVVRLWDRRYGARPVRSLRGHNNRVTSVAWSRSHCEIVLSGDCDGALRLWNARVGPHFVMHHEDHETGIVGCGFSSVNSRQFFCATRDGRVVRDELSIDFLACYAPSLSSENKEIETLLYQRDFGSAFERLSERATRLWEDGRTDEAAHLLKLSSRSTFTDVANEPDMASFSKFVSELAYYLPPHSLRLSPPEQAHIDQIQLLKVREALVAFVEEGQYKEIAQLQEQICAHIERKNDAFSVDVLRDVLLTTYEHDYLSALRLACAICASLKGAKLFSSFLEIATIFLVPTVTPLSSDMDEDPKLVLSQMELLRDLHEALQRPGPAQAVIALIQAYPDKRRIMSREVHLLYMHALLARHNYDVLFIWGSSLVRTFSRGSMASDFADVIQTLLHEKAFPQFKDFLEKSLAVNPRLPWDSSSKIRSVLTVTNVLSNAESLDKKIVEFLGECLNRLSRALRDALREMIRHPNYESIGPSGRADAAERIRKVLDQFEYINARRARKTSFHSDKISSLTASLTRLLNHCERAEKDGGSSSSDAEDREEREVLDDDDDGVEDEDGLPRGGLRSSRVS